MTFLAKMFFSAGLLVCGQDTYNNNAFFFNVYLWVKKISILQPENLYGHCVSEIRGHQDVIMQKNLLFSAQLIMFV